MQVTWLTKPDPFCIYPAYRNIFRNYHYPCHQTSSYQCNGCRHTQPFYPAYIHCYVKICVQYTLKIKKQRSKRCLKKHNAWVLYMYENQNLNPAVKLNTLCLLLLSSLELLPDCNLAKPKP